MSKGLLHVAARDRAEEKLIDRLLEEAERQSGDQLSVAVLSQVRTDPLGSRAPFRGTLELRASAEPSLGVLAEAVRDLASRIEDVAHADLSSALFGVEHPIVPCAPMPVRYQYLMRRRVDFSHERYLPDPAFAGPTHFLAVMGMPFTEDGEIDGENLTLACRNAVLNMIELLQERGFSREQAYIICSVAVDLRISNVVDVPNYVVSALLPEGIFEA